MLILLDENLLSQKLKQPFLDEGHSISNVYDMGWRGLKDREILDRSENHPFDVFVTADKNLPYQQNLASRVITIVVLDSSSTRPDHLVPLMRQVSTMISSLPAGSAVRINDAGDVVSISPRSRSLSPFINYRKRARSLSQDNSERSSLTSPL